MSEWLCIEYSQKGLEKTLVYDQMQILTLKFCSTFPITRSPSQKAYAIN